MEIQRSALDFIVAPREICTSCNAHSGPKFYLSRLKEFSPMLREPTIPSGHEREMVQTDISSVQSEISALDSEMKRLQASMDKLARRRTELRWVKKQGKGLFSPIRKLPAELLRAIFHQPQLRSQISVDMYCPKSFIQTAIEVCYNWRCVAHSCAELWSNISASLYDTYKDKMSPRSPFLEKCITLSREFPLQLHLNNNCTPKILGESCVKTLAQNAYRWEHIHIQNASLLQAIDMYFSENAEFTQLQSLDLGINLDVRVSPITLQPTPKLASLSLSPYKRDVAYSLSFSSVPSLTKIKLSGITHPSTYLHNFPWSQITDAELYVEDLAQGELHCILQYMSGLRSLSLKGSTEGSWPIVLSNLQELKLNGFSIENIYDNLTMPHLKTLRVNRYCDERSVIGFFQRSSCKLEELELEKISIDDEHFHETWLDIPEVRRIKKLHWVKPPSWSISPGIRWLAKHLPELEILHIKGMPASVTSSNYQFDRCAKEVIDMLKARLMAASQTNGDTNSSRSILFMHPMKAINIGFDSYLTDDEEHDFKEFIESDLVRQSDVEIVITPMGEEVYYDDY